MSNHKPYLPEEVLENFEALLADLDCRREFAMLGVGPLHFLLRRRLKAELDALTTGLWRLNLERSFPDDCSTLFESYLTAKHAALGGGKAADTQVARIREYVTLLEEKREADFTAPAARVVALIGVKEPRAAALRLKMVLRIRILYKLLFDRLI